jgi:hypothetical protein
MLDLGVTLTNAFVVVAVGAILAYLTTDRFRTLREEIDRLRAEMTEGFGSLRAEMTQGDGSLRAEMTEGFGSLRAEMAEGFGSLRAEMTEQRTGLKGDIARLEDRIDAGLSAVHTEIVQVALAVGARGKTAEG